MFLEFFIKLILFSTSVKEKVFWFLTMKMNEYKAIEADAMQQPSEVLLLFQRYAMALFLYTRKECLWLLPILIFSLCCFIMSWVYVTSGSFRVFWWAKQWQANKFKKIMRLQCRLCWDFISPRSSVIK